MTIIDKLTRRHAAAEKALLDNAEPPVIRTITVIDEQGFTVRTVDFVQRPKEG